MIFKIIFNFINKGVLRDEVDKALSVFLEVLVDEKANGPKNDAPLICISAIHSKNLIFFNFFTYLYLKFKLNSLTEF